MTEEEYEKLEVGAMYSVYFENGGVSGSFLSLLGGKSKDLPHNLLNFAFENGVELTGYAKVFVFKKLTKNPFSGCWQHDA